MKVRLFKKLNKKASGFLKIILYCKFSFVISVKDWYCKLKSLILVVKKNEQVNYLAVPQFICRQFICRTGIIWIVYNNLRSATDALSYCRQRSINKLGWGHLILLTRSVYHVYSRYHKRCTCITSIVNICVTLQFEILCKRCTRRTNKEQVYNLTIG